jgi:hypothetical protein
VTTFLSPEEPERSSDAECLARALVELSSTAHGRRVMIDTIDGAPAPESPLAAILAEYGFGARQGALVHTAPIDSARMEADA